MTNEEITGPLDGWYKLEMFMIKIFKIKFKT